MKAALLPIRQLEKISTCTGERVLPQKAAMKN